MTIERYRNDNPRDAEAVATAIESELQAIKPSAPVVRGTQNYAFVRSLARTIAAQQEQSLAALYSAAYVTDATGTELTKRARELGVKRQAATDATGVIEFQRDSAATTDYVVPSGTVVGTGGDDPVRFETVESTTINGPYIDTDTTLYSTSNTSYTVKTSFTVDADFRDSIDVSGDIRTTNSSYTASLEIVDTTSTTTIGTFSTTNTSLTTKSTTYDISSVSGDITIEFRIKISNSSGTAELDNSTVNPSGQTATDVDARCTEDGSVGNLGADTLTVLVSGSVSGVDSVTNPQPTGDPADTLTDGQTQQTLGQEREPDASLRERVLDSTAIGGAGTAEATELAIENIEDVISADVFTNRSDTTVDGVSPWHTEVRVYGGDVTEIGRRLYETLPLLAVKTLEGGVNGTKDSTTISTDLYGDLSIPITRPTETVLDCTIDVVHTDTYAGDGVVTDAIVSYVGGTTTDGKTVTGTGQGENVLVNEVENVAEDVRGVDYADVTLLDADDDGTDDTTTDSDGVPIYDVGTTEVARIDASTVTVNATGR